MFANLKGRDLFLLSLLLTALLGVAWYYGIFSGIKTRIDEQRTTLEQRQLILTQYRAASAALPNLRTEVADLEIKSENFLAALPATADIGEVIRELYSNAELVGAEVTNYGVTQTQAASATSLPAGVAPIAVNLTVSGPFSSLFQFVRSVEELRRFTTVSGINMNMTQATSLNPNLSGNINVTIYTFSPNAAQGSATAPATPNAAPPTPDAPASGGTQ